MLRSVRKLPLTDVQSNVKKFKDIPGPITFPVIGNLHLYKLGYFRVSQYHKVLKHLSDKYGPLVRQRLGREEIIHVFDPADARKVYQAEGRMPAVSPLQGTVQLYRSKRDLSLGLGNMNGEDWYRLRSAVQQFMLKPAAVSHFLSFVDTAAKSLVQRLKYKVPGSSPNKDFFNEIAKWSLESASQVCFERSLGCFDGGQLEFEAQLMIDANKRIFELSGDLKFSLPIYKYIPTPKWTELVDYEDFFYGSALRFVNEAKAKLEFLRGQNKAEGKLMFLSNLLSKHELSSKDVDIITLSLFGDGLSTTTPFLIFCLHCMAVNWEWQAKLRQEIFSVANYDSSLTSDIFSHLPYLRAFIKEVFRMYPNGTEISRILQQDMVLSGYEVPTGTHVNLNQSVNYRSEKYFAEPDKFAPERWLRSENAQSIDPYLLTPFGHGTRTCAGRRFAEQDLHVVLIRLLQKFRIETVAAKPMEQVYRTLLFPQEPINIVCLPL